MSQATYHPLEEILRLIARNSPHPWYPRQFLRESRADPDQVSAILEHLALEGLIEKVPGGSLEGGSGVVLTELGHEAVRDTALMDRLIRGEALRPDDVGGVIRNDLRTAGPPYATYTLIAINVLIYLLARPGTPFFDQGGARAGKIEQGEWWRLLTCMFLHGGLMHLGCNMFSLYSVGSFVEQAWGRWRFLVIYFVAGWAGSCLGMAYHPPNTILVGASGAVCGVLGAVGVWFLLYRRYLRAEAASSGLWQVGTSIALIALMGYMIPNISNWGHLGGGIGGALAAVVLHIQRFGLPGVSMASGLRWVMAGVLLLILPAASYMQMKNAWAKQDGRQARQDDDGDDKADKDGKPAKKDRKKDKGPEPAGVAGPFLRHYAEPVSTTADALLKTCGRVDLNVGKAKTDERNKTTLTRVSGHRKELAELKAELEKKEYDNERVEDARKDALKLLAESLSLCDFVTAYLKAPDAEGKEKVKSQFEAVNKQLNDFDETRDTLRKRS